MPEWVAEVATLLTGALLLGYELALLRALRLAPQRTARSAHAELRADWFAAISAQPGSEILAVQTLRNALMAATLTASTSVLGLAGAVGLAAPSLHAALSQAAPALPGLQLAMELWLLGLLCSSFIASAMALRFFNHAGFIAGMPVASTQRQRWAASGAIYLRRAGLFYSWGLRHLMLVPPVLAALVHPLIGLVAALATVALLFAFDRVGAN